MDISLLIQHAFGPVIIALVTAGLSIVRKISEDLTELTIATKELQIRLLSVDDGIRKVNDTLDDHENRIRQIERK